MLRRRLVVFGSLIVLLLTAFITAAAPVSAASYCPQTAQAAANTLTASGATGNQQVQASDMSVLIKDHGKVVSWKFDAPSLRWVMWPLHGAIDWGGRADGSGVQHGWSTSDHHRVAPMTGFAWHCYAKRGANNGRALSKWPRSNVMASKLLSNGAAPASDFGLDPTSNLGHWLFDGHGTNYALYAKFGRWDIATNGQADHICPGQSASRSGGSWWALGTC